MPYRDPEKRREYMRVYRNKAVNPESEVAHDVNPKCKPSVNPRKPVIGERCSCCGMTDEERAKVLQWGLDLGKIKVSDEVMAAYRLRESLIESVNKKLARGNTGGEVFVGIG